ncbi:MAG: glycoside hydrolase family 28 protein, partial [Bacteroidetes bacterium]|nr:glycoside hydrolase family 28 protein [Bacteroidota bacterium]
MKIRSLFSAGLLVATATQAQLPAAAVDAWKHMPVIQQPVFKKDTFNITRYGAVADGVTLNTKSINDAIADCSRKGGGVVLVPPGLWMTGPIVLKSNVNLHLEGEAILQMTKDFDQYPLVEGNFEGNRSARNQSPVSGTDLVNVAITGSGTIDGNGEAWRMLGKDRVTESQWKKLVASGGVLSDDGKRWYPSAKNKKGNEQKLSGVLTPGKTLKDFEDIKDFLRPNLVVLTNCRKVLLEGVSFRQSPAW